MLESRIVRTDSAQIEFLFSSSRGDWIEAVSEDASGDEAKKIGWVRDGLESIERWEDFVGFCEKLPIVNFHWAALMEQIVTNLEVERESPTGGQYARKLLDQARDLQATVDPAHADRSYDRYVQIEKVTDHSDPLAQGRNWGDIKSRLSGWNEWTQRCLGQPASELLRELEQRPRVRFVPNQSNDNFAIGSPSEREYEIYLDGHRVVSLVTKSGSPKLKLRNLKSVRNLLGIAEATMSSSTLGDLFLELSGRNRTTTDATPEACHRVISEIRRLLDAATPSRL